jgi:hypothetical protein
MHKKLQAWWISGLTIGVLAAATGAADAVDTPTSWQDNNTTGTYSTGTPTIRVTVGNSTTTATRLSTAGTWAHKAEQYCNDDSFRQGPWRGGSGSSIYSTTDTCGSSAGGTDLGRGWFRLP